MICSNRFIALILECNDKPFFTMSVNMQTSACGCHLDLFAASNLHGLFCSGKCFKIILYRTISISEPYELVFTNLTDYLGTFKK